jgi:hypothetical protein
VLDSCFLGKGELLEQPEDFEDDHNDDNYSNYVKDVSAHVADSYQIAHARVNIYPNLPASRGVSFAAKFRLTKPRCCPNLKIFRRIPSGVQ